LRNGFLLPTNKNDNITKQHSKVRFAARFTGRSISQTAQVGRAAIVKSNDNPSEPFWANVKL
jgi:hypothetical protein